LFFEVDNRTVGKHAPHTLLEYLPLICAVEIVAHEKAVAQQVFAKPSGLGIGEFPVAHLHGIQKRPVVGIAFIQIHRLFHTAAVDPAQAAHRLGEMPIGTWIVRGPTGISLRPVAAAEAPLPKPRPP
jgi:hypothetical protein